MAKTLKTDKDSANALLPRQEGESLFKHTFTNLHQNAENAGWNLYDPRMSAFVSFVTNDDFLTSYTLQGGSADDAVQFGMVGHEKRLEMADVGQDLKTSDGFIKDIYAALKGGDENALNALISKSVETPVVATGVQKPAAVVLHSPEQANVFWNAYTNIATKIEDNGKADVYDYNRELLTYIQADPRYLDFHKAYLEGNTDLSAKEKDGLEAIAVQAHEDSVKALDETDGFSTNLYANAQDFYFGIEQNYDVKPQAPATLAPVFDAAAADKILGTELTKAPDVPVVTITQPSSPDVLPEQIDKTQFNADILEEKARVAQAELEKAKAANADILPVVDKTTPASFTDIPVTKISDASILLDGKGSNDIAYLKDLAKEAKAAGVDVKLINKIEANLDGKDFVTTKFATKGVQAYSDALKEALKDGVVGKSEYNNALTKMFTVLADEKAMAVDRKGLVDDIAAPKGMEDIAKRSMSQFFTAHAQGTTIAANTPEAPTFRGAAPAPVANF